jgi:hypothetical protein
MITKDFLQTYPILKRMKVTYDRFYSSQFGTKGSISDVARPPINMHCKICKSEQTFNMDHLFEHFDVQNISRIPPLGKIFEMRYVCASCKSYRHYFYVEFGLDSQPKSDAKTFTGWVRKVGQRPPWEIKINKSLEKALGTKSKTYKNGLICESQSYGIGAYAYFRRITEVVIDELLESINELIDEKSQKEYVAALKKVKKTRVTEEKIKLVEDLLPSTLQPDGYNPLKALYSALSDGLHNKSDEDCLEKAEAIKEILIYLLEQIEVHKHKSKRFSEKMKKLLEKK